MHKPPICMYVEHMPMVDSLWLGEGFDYNETPDYWLVEISGIPFGLFGEMLQGGGNPWRGMIYGMTGRICNADPRPIWKLWDDFGIQDARMIGYWDSACPVKTDHQDVLATAYVKQGKTLVSVASWAPQAGRMPAEDRLEGPGPGPGQGEDHGRQDRRLPARRRVRARSDEIPVEPGRGWLLVLHE